MSFITGVHIKQWACLSPFLHFGYFIIPLPHSTLLSHISPASKLIDVLKTQILRFHAMFLYVYYVYLYFLNACRIVDLCREVFSYLKGVQPNATPFPFSRVTINQLLLFYLSFIPPRTKLFDWWENFHFRWDITMRLVAGRNVPLGLMFVWITRQTWMIGCDCV